MLDDLAGYLRQLNIPENVIDNVMSTLASNATTLESTPLSTISQHLLGGASVAPSLAWNASLAHDHVHSGIQQTAKGLHGYRDNLNIFKRDVTEQDDNSSTAIAAHSRTLDQVKTILAPDTSQVGNGNFHGTTGSDGSGSK